MNFGGRAFCDEPLAEPFDWSAEQATDNKQHHRVDIQASDFRRDRSVPAQPIAHADIGRDEAAQPKVGHPMKRSFDLFFAIVMIVATLPVMIVIAVGIKIVAPGPVLFLQQRIGQDGLPFTCLKFRTMVVDARERLAHLLESDPSAREEWERDQKLKNDPRITRFGAMLRTSSLDELPQLFNILFGHMSVVGPRPIVADEVSRYGLDIRHYYAVRPGLTGLWQTSGRNDTSYEERVRLDVEYVRNVSFARDLSICFKTVPAMVLSRGSY